MGAWDENPLGNDTAMDLLGDLGYEEDFAEIRLPDLIRALERCMGDMESYIDGFRAAAHVMAVQYPEAMAPLAADVVEGFKTVLADEQWLNSWSDRDIVEDELRNEMQPWVKVAG